MTDIVSNSTEKKSHLWGRDKLDWYVESQNCTRLLLTKERFVGAIWDPACGQGNIVRAARLGGYKAFGSDLVDRCGNADWFLGYTDFLNPHNSINSAPNIITNPPFFRAKGTEAFIRRALQEATGKVCIFTDLKFLASGGRARGIYAERPPNRIWQLADRPSCPPGEYLAAGNKAGGGTADWIWMVWSMTDPPVKYPAFGWLYDEIS